MIFLVNLDDFFAMICTGFHEVVVSTRYVPKILSHPKGDNEANFVCFPQIGEYAHTPTVRLLGCLHRLRGV